MPEFVAVPAERSFEPSSLCLEGLLGDEHVHRLDVISELVDTGRGSWQTCHRQPGNWLVWCLSRDARARAAVSDEVRAGSLTRLDLEHGLGCPPDEADADTPGAAAFRHVRAVVVRALVDVGSVKIEDSSLDATLSAFRARSLSDWLDGTRADSAGHDPGERRETERQRWTTDDSGRVRTLETWLERNLDASASDRAAATAWLDLFAGSMAP